MPLSSPDSAAAASMPSSGWQYYTHFTALFGLGVVAPVFQVIADAPEFFVARRATVTDFILISLFCLVVQPALLTLPCIAARWTSLRLASLLFQAIMFLLFSVLFCAVLNRYIIFDRLAIVIALLMGWVALRLYQDLKPIRSAISVLFAAVLAMPVVYLFLTVPSGEDEMSSRSLISGTKSGTHPPIVMVLLDELPLVALLDSNGELNARAFPNFARLQSHSHWFRNASTVAAFTDIAVPAILTGNFPSFERRKFPRFLDYQDNLFTLLGEKYEINAYEQVTRLCPAALCGKQVFEEPLSERVARLLSEVFDMQLRVALPAPDYLAAVNHLGHLYRMIRALFNVRAETDVDEIDYRGFVRIAAWDDDKKLFMKFVSELKNSEAPALFFVHVTFPHVPYQYFPSGRQYYTDQSLLSPTGFVETMPDDPGLALIHQQRFLLQLQYADRLLGTLLDKLKALSMYDRSLVLVTADHGTSFESSSPTRGLSETNAAQVLMIPLLFKLPNQTTPQIHDQNVSSVDILPTILDVAGIEPLRKLMGTSLLKPPDRPEKRFFSLNMAHIANVHVLPPILELRSFADRQARIFGAELENIFNYGIYPELRDRPEREVPRLAEPTFAVSLHGRGRFAKVSKARGAKSPGLVRGDITGPSSFTGRVVVALVLNDRLQGVTVSTAMRNGKAEFEGLVPDIGFHEGRNSIQAFAMEVVSQELLQRLSLEH